jgi:hypothetical protein
MMHMMALSGLHPEVATRRDPRTDTTMKEVRNRCRECPAEELCDQWLAGRAKGDNSFCPNAWAFRVLAGKIGRTRIESEVRRSP